MNLQWLYYFNTIAELEHYTRAAERLHVSQSNLRYLTWVDKSWKRN